MEERHSDAELEAMLGRFQVSQPEHYNCEGLKRI